MPDIVSTVRKGCDQRDRKAFGVEADSFVHWLRKEGASFARVTTMGVTTSDGNARVLYPVLVKSGIGGAK